MALNAKTSPYLSPVSWIVAHHRLTRPCPGITHRVLGCLASAPSYASLISNETIFAIGPPRLSAFFSGQISAAANERGEVGFPFPNTYHSARQESRPLSDII